MKYDETDFFSDLKYNVKGILGNNLMKEYAWYFSKENIHIIKKVKLIEDIFTYKKGKLQGKSNYPTLISTFRKPRATTLFDTGDNAFFEIGEEVLQYLPAKELRSGKGVSGKRAFSEDTMVKVVKTNKFEILGLTLDNPIAYVGQGRRFFLGAEFLEFFDIIIDFPRRKYYVRQNAQYYESDLSNTFGFNTKIENENLFVNMIWHNSEADKKGIEIGDKILKINKLNVLDVIKFKKAYEAIQIISTELKKQNISLKLMHDNGIEKTYNLSKKFLFE